MLTDIPSEVQQGVRSLVQARMHTELLDFTFVGGGCINHGGCLNTSSGELFLKWNEAAKLNGMFHAEARGLQLLRDTKSIAVPEVIGFGESGPFQYLVLAFVGQGQASKQFWINFGRRLAHLHRVSAAYFGLDHDNYIGSLRQFNSQDQSWTSFFIEKRLQVQVALAVAKGSLTTQEVRKFDQLYTNLLSFFPDEKSSLLHGDLWSGNFLINQQAEPCLIDPAVYYGNREADLAMTRLFGGFDEMFYRGYDEIFPLMPGYKERFDVYNLYPLLVHLNLFGGAYRKSIDDILNRFD